MTWIRTIDEADATGELRAVYEEQELPGGHVPNIWKVHSLRPNILTAHTELHSAILYQRGALSRVQREMITVTVSALNDCHY